MKGLVLTRQFRDSAEDSSSQSLVYWLATDDGPMRIEITDQESVFFIRASQLDTVRMVLGKDLAWRHAQLELKCFQFPDEFAVACYFKNQRDLAYARTRLQQQSVLVFEGDVQPSGYTEPVLHRKRLEFKSIHPGG